MKKFSIIEFEREEGQVSNSIDIVPSHWLDIRENIKTCYWPPKAGSNFATIVKRCDTVQNNWKLYNFIRIIATSDNYDSARKKLQDAENHSTVETETDAAPKTKLRPRKRMGIRKPTSPLKKSKLSNVDSDAGSDSDSSGGGEELAAPPKPLLTLGLNLPDPDTGYAESQSVESINDPLGTVADNEKAQSEASSNAQIEKSADGLDEQTLEGTLLSIVNSDDIGAIKSFLIDFAGKAMTAVEELTEEVLDIKSTLATLQLNGGTALPDFKKLYKLLVNSVEELAKLESWLATEANSELLATYISLIGGANVDKNTRKVLSRIFGNEIRKKINFVGKGGKTGLQHLNVLEVIKVGIRKGNPTAQDDTLESSAKSWFRYCKIPAKQNGNPK